MLWKKESKHGVNRIPQHSPPPPPHPSPLLLLNCLLICIFSALKLCLFLAPLYCTVERWLAWCEAVWGWGNKPASGPWPTLLAPPFSCLADKHQARARTENAARFSMVWFQPFSRLADSCQARARNWNAARFSMIWFQIFSRHADTCQAHARTGNAARFSMVWFQIFSRHADTCQARARTGKAARFSMVCMVSVIFPPCVHVSNT